MWHEHDVIVNRMAWCKKDASTKHAVSPFDVLFSVFENLVVKRIFGIKKRKQNEDGENYSVIHFTLNMEAA